MITYVCNRCGYEKTTSLGIKNCPDCKGQGTMERKEKR